MNLQDLTQPTLLRERTEHETDVLNEVTKQLQAANYILLSTWLKEPDIAYAAGKNSELQRFLISRNFRIKLGSSNLDTRLERFVLDSPVENKEYISNMKKHIIPTLVKLTTFQH